jgi:hypothetical protein
MEALLLVAFGLMGIAGMTVVAMLVASKQYEAAQRRAMLESRLVAISTRQRRDYFND